MSDALPQSQSFDWFQSIVEDSGDAIYALSLDGEIRTWNAGAERLYGFTAREAIGRYVSMLTPGGHDKEIPHVLERLRGGEAVEHFASQQLRRDGRRVLVSLAVSPVRDAAGAVSGAAFIARDMAPLIESEATSRAIIESSVNAIITIDEHGRIESVNPAGERLFGYTAGELMGQSISIVMPQPYRGEHHDYLARYRETGEKRIIGTVREAAGLRKDGTIFPAELTVSEVVLGDRRLFAGIVRDISRRRQAEEALRESEARLKAIVETAADPIVTIDDRGRIESFNPAAARVFGYAADEVIGRNVSMLMPEPYRSEHDGYIAHYRETGEQRIVGVGREVVGQRKGGETFPMDLAIGEVTLGDRRLFTGIVRDLSERKSLESQKMEVVGRLAGGVAQDINNLMTAIIGHAVLGPAALDTDDPLRQDFDAIRSSAEDAASLAHQLLAFARKGRVEPAAVDLNTVVAGMGPMLERMIEQHMTLVTEPGGGLGLTWLDPNQFEHVVLHLVLNARDAMPQGGRIVIATANVRVDERAALSIGGIAPGAYVMLSVRDSGQGLTPEARAHLFEPFFTTKEQGKGIGLATSYGIVRQAGGGIRVESTAGAGTAFEIYLPRIDVLESAAPQPERRTEPPRGHERILVVEDEEAVRKITVKILDRMGYDVAVAQDGVEALALAERERFEIIVTDVVMPRMGGVAMVKALRERGIDAKVLFVSGYAEDTAALEDIGGEASAFLQKPFSPAVLAGKVRDILDAR
jgi:PAS domain S-box-containing protein